MEKNHEVEAKKARLLDEAVEQLIKIYKPLAKAGEAIGKAAHLEDNPSRAALYVNHAIKFDETRIIIDNIAKFFDTMSYHINTAEDREE